MDRRGKPTVILVSLDDRFKTKKSENRRKSETASQWLFRF